MASQPEQPAVFVEGLDVSAYGIARSLGREGIPVYALNDRLRDALQFSRYYRKCFLYPDDPTQSRAYAGDSVANEDVLLGLLLQWGREFQSKPVLFATSDWFSRFVSNRAKELAANFLFPWVPPELFTTIIDKGKMARFCGQHGIRVPRTHATSPDDDMARLAREFSYPCLVKPIHRYTTAFPLGTAKVFVAHQPGELETFFEQHPQLKGAALVQELIEGGDDQVFQCTALVDMQGEIAAYSTVRKLSQYPVGYGSMCYGRTERNDELKGEAFKLLQALGYKGLGSLEFKYRRSDGGYYFIEMNTRLPWYNGLFADAGVNLAWLAYCDLTGQKSTATKQVDGITWMSYQNYSKWYGEAGRQSGTSPLRFARTVAGATSYAWWNRSDPRPFVGTAGYAARRTVGAVLRRLGLR
jgi:D-aspartate ligase